MRPVFSTENPEEFHEACRRLVEAGIPVTEPSNYADLPGFRVGPRYRTVCVWLDEHHDDALALLADPDHVVRHPVTPEEFARMADEVSEAQEAYGDRIQTGILNGLAVLVVVGLLVFGVFRVLRAA